MHGGGEREGEYRGDASWWSEEEAGDVDEVLDDDDGEEEGADGEEGEGGEAGGGVESAGEEVDHVEGLSGGGLVLGCDLEGEGDGVGEAFGRGGVDGFEGLAFGRRGGDFEGIGELGKELAGIAVGGAHDVVEGAGEGVGSCEVGGAVLAEVVVALDEGGAADGVDELCEGEEGCGEVEEFPTEGEGNVESAGVSEEGDVVVAGEGEDDLCGEGDEEEPEVGAFDEFAVAEGAEVGPSEAPDG